MHAHDDGPRLPAANILILTGLLRGWGYDDGRLFDGFDLDAARLDTPGATVDLPTFAALVERARRWTGEPGLAAHLALQMRVSAHGYVGFAAMSAATVGEALDIACRFAPIRTTALSLRLGPRLGHDAERAALWVEEHADFGAARDVVIFGLVGGLVTIARALTGHPLHPAALGLRFETAITEPPWAERLTAVFGAPVAFDQPAHRLLFDAAALDLPLQASDPAALALARATCERALAAIAPRRSTRARVREALPRPDGGFRTLAEVARALGLSPRTLKRWLAAEGTHFRAVLDEVRLQRAEVMLREGHPLEQIAARLGYADATGFARAFKRRTGRAPGDGRRAPPQRDR